MLSGFMILFFMAFLIFGGAGNEILQPQMVEAAVADGAEKSYEILTLYSDVNFWRPPVWEVSEDTVMGQITEKTGVALDTIIPAQGGDTQLSLILHYNKPPDIISVADETLISQLVTSGKVWNLDELLREYCPDSHLLTAFPEDMKKELIRRDGAWYAYPSHIDSEDAYRIWEPSTQFYVDYKNCQQNNGIIWNRQILEQLGLSVEELKTEEQVLQAFQTVKEQKLTINGENVIPILLDGQDYQKSSLMFLCDTFGAEYIDEDGHYKDRMLQPESRHAMKFINELYRRQYLNPAQLTIDNDSVKDLLASGKVLCFIGNLANTAVIPSEWISSGAICSMDGKKSVLGKNTQAQTGWLSTFVTKECEHPELAAAWLDFMTSEEGMRLACFGLEGKDYTLDENGLLMQTEAGKVHGEDYQETGIYAWWMFHNFAWERSIMRAPEPGSLEYQEYKLSMAYGEDPNTVIYDSSALYIPGEQLEMDSLYGRMDSAISRFIAGRIPVIVLSESEESFEKEFDEFILYLENKGIHKLDEKKDELFRENMQLFNLTMTKINAEADHEKNQK